MRSAQLVLRLTQLVVFAGSAFVFTVLMIFSADCSYSSSGEPYGWKTIRQDGIGILVEANEYNSKNLYYIVPPSVFHAMFDYDVEEVYRMTNRWLDNSRNSALVVEIFKVHVEGSRWIYSDFVGKHGTLAEYLVGQGVIPAQLFYSRQGSDSSDVYQAMIERVTRAETRAREFKRGIWAND